MIAAVQKTAEFVASTLTTPWPTTGRQFIVGVNEDKGQVR